MKDFLRTSRQVFNCRVGDDICHILGLSVRLAALRKLLLATHSVLVACWTLREMHSRCSAGLVR